jgi:hypothetical protein
MLGEAASYRPRTVTRSRTEAEDFCGADFSEVESKSSGRLLGGAHCTGSDRN